MRALAWLLMAMMLSGCDGDGDRMAYIPPKAPGGRLCLMQCERARGYCGESCDLDYRACYAAMQQKAQLAYNAYARQVFETRMPATRTPSSFEDRQSCGPGKKICTDACTDAYNSCFVTCGGTLSPP